MNPRPLTMAPVQREMLREFERLHEEWRTASEAADAIECAALRAEREEVDRLVEFRRVAERAHQEAMRLLRERPI